MNFPFDEVPAVIGCYVSLGAKQVGGLSFDFSIAAFEVVVLFVMRESKLV